MNNKIGAITIISNYHNHFLLPHFFPEFYQINNLENLIYKVKTSFPGLKYLSLLGNSACPNQLSGLENDENDYQRYR